MNVVALVIQWSVTVHALKYYVGYAFTYFLAVCMLILLSPFGAFAFFARPSSSSSLFDLSERLFNELDLRTHNSHEKLSKTSK